MKRLFFAFEVEAPWPEPLPAGRHLVERHLTLAFLGQCDENALHEALEEFPPPPFQVGLVGLFDRVLFLPEHHPRVVAWHVNLEQQEALANYYRELNSWLRDRGFKPDVHDAFLPHVTLCRAPFDPHAWKKHFEPLPMRTGALHLYESLGGLRYQPIWSQPMILPFEEMVNSAFQISGENLPQLQLHAAMALTFKCPAMLDHLPQLEKPESLDDLITHLNQLIAQAHPPFKILPGELSGSEILTWEIKIDQKNGTF